METREDSRAKQEARAAMTVLGSPWPWHGHYSHGYTPPKKHLLGKSIKSGGHSGVAGKKNSLVHNSLMYIFHVHVIMGFFIKNPIITCTWKVFKYWTQLWGTIVQQQASRQKKRNLKVDLGKCVQMYRAPFLYLPEFTKSTPGHNIKDEWTDRDSGGTQDL